MKPSFLNPPQFLSLPFFGLSMSATSIRLTKFKTKKIGNIPTVIEEVFLKEQCDFFSHVDSYSECVELKKILKDLKKKHKIQFVQLSIPEEYTYVFRVLVPINAIELIEDFITNNIEQYVPLAASDVFFDYKVLKSHTQDEFVPVIVTAITKVVITKYTSLLEECKISVLGCESEVHAIARCVVLKGDINPYILININKEATNISIIEEGFVQYTQTVPIKMSDVTPLVSNDIRPLFRDSINKIIIYWFTSKEQHVQSAKIENVILTGENIESSDLINFLESNLSVNAVFANVWTNCFDVHDYIPAISSKESLKYATCIGLSLYKIK